MALQPPSFFQAPSSTSQRQSKDTGNLKSVTHNPPCPGHFLPANSTASHVLHPPGQQVAMLTSDLLAVENHLQSRMRLLEEEKRNLISKVVELEKNLVQQKEEREAQLETLTAQHNQTLLQAQLEVKQLSTECDRLREEGGSRAAQLERELKTREEQYSTEVVSLTAKVREQEAHAEALTLELEDSRRSSESELNQLKKQLVAANADQGKLREELEGQLRSVSDELKLSWQRVHELEGYLGGEIPNPPMEKDGRSITWVEERENLHSTIKILERELHKTQSEDRLLNIRLTSLMEILSIQEAAVAKQGHSSVSDDGGVGGKDAESAASLRLLLTRWREKVFVMLVQQKLSQIHDSRIRHEAQRKEAELKEELQRIEREKELLNHSLADRNAELQLQINKTSLAEQRLKESHEITQHLQCQLQAQNDHLSRVLGRIQSVHQVQGTRVTSVNQAMTRMANYERRLSTMNARINSMKATLNYQRAVGQRSKPVPAADCGVQTESIDSESCEAQDLTSLSRVELIGEVRSLSRERSNLVRQLEESTATFEEQMDKLNNTCSSKLAATEARLSSVQRENCSLNEQLSQLRSESEALGEKEEEVRSRVEELEKELRETKSTMETRVDVAVREQQQLNSEGMAEMEKLLSVARREHGKAVVQLQQLQRQLSRDKDRATEAMSLNQARLEQQLAACRKKLEASQVERNLFLSVLRQEGIAVPVKQRASPRRRLPSEASDKEEEEMSSTSSRLETSQEPEGDGHSNSSLSNKASQPPTLRRCEHQHGQSQQPSYSQTQDIREVLKDLQVLSSSLLEMETPQAMVDDQTDEK